MTIAIDRAVRHLRESRYRRKKLTDVQGKKVVTGVNASSSSIQGGRNEHCRLYSYADDS